MSRTSPRGGRAPACHDVAGVVGPFSSRQRAPSYIRGSRAGRCDQFLLQRRRAPISFGTCRARWADTPSVLADDRALGGAADELGVLLDRDLDAAVGPGPVGLMRAS